MNQPQTAPYGSWKSPITSEMIVTASIGLGETAIDGERIYWIESRPSEGGRSVIMRQGENAPEQMTPAGFNVRTAVHEYGGGAFMVHEGIIYFSNFSDGRIYRQAPGADPEPLTAAVAMRYSDLVIDTGRNRLVCVREDHTESDLRPINSLVAIDLATGEQQSLVSGADFYAYPRLSPDGSQLAWISWNMPEMPWDGTELWTSRIVEDGTLLTASLIAGSRTESIFQPEWSPDGILHFVSDRTGWWNLYRLRGDSIEPLHPTEAEFGEPMWVFKSSTYVFESPERIVCKFKRNGRGYLATLDTRTRELTELDLPFTDYRHHIDAMPGRVICGAASPTRPWSIISVDPATGAFEHIQQSSTLELDPGYLSIPGAIEFPSGGGAIAHAFFYPPANPEYTATQGEFPPLMVISHGGPTGSTATAFDLKIQYWTSRGIAVLDVNYGGSTGYGRAYRERLNGNWGVVDVEDCINGALYMADRGEIDRDRMMIRGGSAGGYTTLAALTFHTVFRAGASYYGVSDLEALEQDCHKFESQYNHSLLGPYPEARELYRQRSPIHFIDQLSCPIILFQGLEDKVVPANQAEMMFDAMKARGIPVAYLPFAGEQHGFRRAENIKRSLEAELYFYGRIFGFEPADVIEPVEIENLPEVQA